MWAVPTNSVDPMYCHREKNIQIGYSFLSLIADGWLVAGRENIVHIIVANGGHFAQ